MNIYMIRSFFVKIEVFTGNSTGNCFRKFQEYVL